MKVVLAAAMWNCPHLLVLDEPTNYLDRDSLGALAEGIKSFDGGVIMISHNSGPTSFSRGRCITSLTQSSVPECHHNHV